MWSAIPVALLWVIVNWREGEAGQRPRREQSPVEHRGTFICLAWESWWGLRGLNWSLRRLIWCLNSWFEAWNDSLEAWDNWFETWEAWSRGMHKQTDDWMDRWMNGQMKVALFSTQKSHLGPQISPSRPQRSHLRPQVLNQPHNRHLHSSIFLSSRICLLKSSDKSFWYFRLFELLSPLTCCTQLLYSCEIIAI